MEYAFLLLFITMGLAIAMFVFGLVYECITKQNDFLDKMFLLSIAICLIALLGATVIMDIDVIQTINKLS